MRHFKVRGQPADLKRAKVIPTSLIFDGDRPRGIKWQPVIRVPKPQTVWDTATDIASAPTATAASQSWQKLPWEIISIILLCHLHGTPTSITLANFSTDLPWSETQRHSERPSTLKHAQFVKRKLLWQIKGDLSIVQKTHFQFLKILSLAWDGG